MIRFGAITFDGVTYDALLFEEPYEKRLYHADIRGRHGAVVLDDSDVAAKTFRIQGVIHGIDRAAFETARDTLKTCFGRKGLQRLVTDTGTHYWAECKSFIIPEQPDDPYGAPFSAYLLCPHPFREADAETINVVQPTGWCRIATGVNGNAPVYPLIKITGSVTNPKIVTADSLLQSKFEGDLAASRSQEWLHSGTAAYAQGRWGDAQGAVVATGSETLSLATAGNIEAYRGTICFNWRHNDNSTARSLLALASDFILKLSAGRKLSFYNESEELEWEDALANETWYHIALTWDANIPERKLYVNGVLRKEVSAYTPPNLDSSMVVIPDGQVCDFRCYSQPLTPAEIQEVFEGLPGDCDDDYASLLYTGTIAGDETLVIDCDRRTVKLNGASVLSAITTVGEDFPSFPATHRDLFYDHTSGTPTIRVSFRDRWY